MVNTSDGTTSKQILDEIIKCRKDLKNAIAASEANLLLKIEELHFKNQQIQKENEALKDEIEQLKRYSKRNGIVISGLNVNEELEIQQICNEINALLGVDISPNQIDDFYRLGKGKKSPIKVILVNFWKKREILKNCFKLKGSSIYINPDLTKQQLDDKNVLITHYKIAKDDKVKDCYIKRNKLYADGSIYTVEDLRQIDANKNQSFTKASSAPQTPVPNQVEKKVEEILESTTQGNIEKTGIIQTPTKSYQQANIDNQNQKSSKPGPVTRLQENRLRTKSSDRK